MIQIQELSIFFFKNEETTRLPSYTKHIYDTINDFTKPKIQYGYNHHMDNIKNVIKQNITENPSICYNIIDNFLVKISDTVNNLHNDIYTLFNIDKKKQKDYTNNFFIYWEIFNVFQNIFNKDLNNIIIDCDNEILESLNFYCTLNQVSYNINKNNKKSNIIIIHTDEKINFYDENIENLCFISIIKKVIKILSNQENNGTCIFNINESYQEPTVKILYILSLLYEEFYIYKPLYSKTYEPEKFIICKNYKYNGSDKNINGLISSLKVIEHITDHIEDIYIEEHISTQFKYFIKYTNYKLSNIQYKTMNKMIEYIKSKDFFGKDYHDFRNIQIKNYEWWKNIFILKNKDISNIYQKSLHAFLNEFNKFIENLYSYF